MYVHAIRNIGIIAHVDAGKTTLAERILYATRRVRGPGAARGTGTTMDSSPIESDRGISIHAAATTCRWGGHTLGLIDTPGHVDFAAEVERALSALDGAVLLLCAVAGAQAQTAAVDRYASSRGVPRLAFINKCDRPGADPVAAAASLAPLGHRPVLLQLPVGLGREFRGVIDLVSRRARLFDEEGGWREAPIPESLRPQADAARAALLEAASEHCDALLEALVEERPVSEDLLHQAIRAGALSGGLTPVLLGSAYYNRGVAALLDAVVRYLPDPTWRSVLAQSEGGELRLETRADAPALAQVFKIQVTRFGPLAWLRVHRGALRAGDLLTAWPGGQRVRVGRLGRLHAGELEPLEEARAGEIAALFGADLQAGVTLCHPDHPAWFPDAEAPEPVVEVALGGKLHKDKLGRALAALTREDPSLRARVDPESRELLLAGMGELHLEVVLTRLRQDYKLAVTAGPPRVSLRQAPTRAVPFNHLLRKQNGGVGQYARIIGVLEPGDGVSFDWAIRGGAIPGTFRGAVQRGFTEELADGAGTGVPVVDARVVILDGDTHIKDSSDQAFERAAREAARAALEEAEAVVLEPLMAVSVEADASHLGAVLGELARRRGRVSGSTVEGDRARVEAEVPLAEMFGYAGALRSVTSGSGAFTMRFARYAPRG
jgi:elongation factor G